MNANMFLFPFPSHYWHSNFKISIRTISWLSLVKNNIKPPFFGLLGGWELGSFGSAVMNLNGMDGLGMVKSSKALG